jgi:hypothetical protein
LLRKRKEHIFILKEGSLKDYLPDGYRSKDIEKLIEFLTSDAFWDALPVDRRKEIEIVVDQMFAVIGSGNKLPKRSRQRSKLSAIDPLVGGNHQSLRRSEQILQGAVITGCRN